MRGIEISWDQISDSKEYYSNKPKPIMSILIYFILFIIVVALIYSFVGKIEIVSKGNGTIRPNEKISVVSSLVSGKISDILYHDGQIIDAYNPLILIENTYDFRINTLQSEIDKIAFEIEMQEKYIESIKIQENNFSSDVNNNEYEYFIRFAALQNTVMSMSNNNETELKKLNTNIDGIKGTISELRYEMEMLTLLKKSIETGEDLLKDDSRYKNIYRHYLLDIEALGQDYSNTLAAIEESNNIIEIESRISLIELSLINYQTLYRSISDNTNHFTSDNPFRSNYEEYKSNYNQNSLAIKRLENEYQELLNSSNTDADNDVDTDYNL